MKENKDKTERERKNEFWLKSLSPKKKREEVTVICGRYFRHSWGEGYAMLHCCMECSRRKTHPDVSHEICWTYFIWLPSGQVWWRDSHFLRQFTHQCNQLLMTATSVITIDTLLVLEPFTSRRLKLQFLTTDCCATGCSDRVAISCSVSSPRRGCSTLRSTWAMAAAAVVSDRQARSIKFELEQYLCIYNCTLNERSNKDVTEMAWQQVPKETASLSIFYKISMHLWSLSSFT